MIVRGRFKYVAALYDGHELYDLEADPTEVRNLVHEAAYREVREELRARLTEHLRARRESGDGKRLLVMLEAGYG
jgi:hypothetical protein